MIFLGCSFSLLAPYLLPPSLLGYASSKTLGTRSRLRYCSLKLVQCPQFSSTASLVQLGSRSFNRATIARSSSRTSRWWLTISIRYLASATISSLFLLSFRSILTALAASGALSTFSFSLSFSKFSDWIIHKLRVMSQGR